MTIRVSPANINQVWVGGVNMYQSLDGGSTWTQNTDWTDSTCGAIAFTHADIHWIEPVPGNSKGFVVCSDGGVGMTTNNGSTWRDLSNNLQIGQQYSVGPSASNPVEWLTGWQDNGGNLSGFPWKHVLGGDNMQCFIDWSNNNNFYSEFYEGTLASSQDAGLDWNYDYGNITDTYANWDAPFLQDPKNPNTIYSGQQNVWKSTDQGNTWTTICSWDTIGQGNGGPSYPADSGGYITALAVDSSNPSYIYAANFPFFFFQGIPCKIEVTANGGTSWRNISAGLPVTAASVSSIAISPKNPNHAWVTFSGYSTGNKVFASTNGGTTWDNISAGLPNLPINCILSQSGNADAIYVGTDQGVYYHDTILNSWVYYSTGLPKVIVTDLKIDRVDNFLLAATFGRGTWAAPFYIPFRATVNVTGNINCYGGDNGSAIVNASNGKYPYNYKWSNGDKTSKVNNLTAGINSVTISDANGCSITLTCVIKQPSQIRDSISISGCKNNKGTATLGVKGGIPPYKYSWSPSGATSASATNLPNGKNSVTVTDNNGCQESQTLFVNCNGEAGPSGGYNQQECDINDIALFPNPNSGEFTLTGTTIGSSIIVYNSIGEKVASFVNSSNTVEMNITNKATGIYLLQIITPDGQYKVLRVIKD